MFCWFCCKGGNPIPWFCDHPTLLFLRVQAGMAPGLMRMEKLNWCYKWEVLPDLKTAIKSLLRAAKLLSFQAGTSPGAGSDAQSFSNIHMPLSTALHNFIQAFKNHSIKIPALPFYPILHPAQVTRYSLKGRQCHIAIVTRVNEDMTFKLLVDLVICFLKSKHLHLDGD